MYTYMLDDVPVKLLSEKKAKREIVCKVQKRAVKCRPDKAVLQILSDLGASFDCASKMEVEKVLGIGVSPDRVIYTHTHKPISSRLYAKRHDESELRKIKLHHPTARLVLRNLLDEQFDARDTFGNKFGCPSDQTRDFLQPAKELEMVVVGISFHVGTDIRDSRAYVAALKQSKSAFEIGLELGFNMNVLDIGGGFPGDKDSPDFFHEIANVLNETLDDLFPTVDGLSTKYFTIQCIDNKAISHESVEWGFTGAGKDCVNPSVQMPELDTGDWLYFEDMGAYIQTVSSNFNGLETAEIKFYCLKDL